MPKKQTKKLVITLLLIDILSIGIFVFLFILTKNLIAQSINAENDIKTELKKEDARVLMKDDLVLGKTYQGKIMNYIIPSDGTVDFIKTLEGLVLNTGLKSDIKNVVEEPYNKDDSVGLDAIRINMDVLGEWKNIQFFLKLLENYPLKIDIKNMSINKFSDNIINGKKTSQWAGSFEFTVVKIKDTK